MSHFKDNGLSFPLPRFVLEALAELRMAFTRMSPHFFRYFLTSWIRAGEERLEFGLAELKQLFTIKQNNGFPCTLILTPCKGRTIIGGTPKRYDRWRENFFLFSRSTRRRLVTSISLGFPGIGLTKSVNDFDYLLVSR